MVDSNAATVDGAYVLTALAYAIILIRLALRRLKHERFKIDDYLMAAAMVLYGLNTAAYPMAVNPHISSSAYQLLTDLFICRSTMGTI